jgi:hypothetical protein
MVSADGEDISVVDILSAKVGEPAALYKSPNIPGT